MLTLSSGEKSFLQQSVRRDQVVRLDILDLATRQVLKQVQSTPADAKAGNKLAIAGGSVRADTSADVLRTCSVELVDPLHELGVDFGQLIAPDRLFQLWKGYRLPAPWGTGGYSLWSLGVFALNGQPEIDASEGKRIVRFAGGDKSCLANKRPRGGFLTAYRISQGTKKTDAIRAIAQYQTWGETQFNLTSDSIVTMPQDIPATDQDSPWELAQTVSAVVEANDRITRLFYDAYGRLTLAMDPGPDIDTLPAVWTAQPVSSGFSQLISARKQADLLAVGNGCRVKYGANRSAANIVTVYDTDTNSPTCVDRIGYFIKDWKNGQQDELIKTAVEANARATFEYRKAKSYQERIPLSLLEQPALEPWDVLQIAEPHADISGKYQLLSFAIDLGTSGVTQAEAWKVRKLT